MYVKLSLPFKNSSDVSWFGNLSDVTFSQSYLLFLPARPTGNKLVARWKFSSRVSKFAQPVRVEFQCRGIGLNGHKMAVRVAFGAGVTGILMCATELMCQLYYTHGVRGHGAVMLLRNNVDLLTTFD